MNSRRHVYRLCAICTLENDRASARVFRWQKMYAIYSRGKLHVFLCCCRLVGRQTGGLWRKYSILESQIVGK